jgi:predicted MPP superfamily phosphohydrolase
MRTMPLLFSFSPLFLIALLAVPGLRLKPCRRASWMWMVLPTLACGLLDALLLTLLPALGLSFGQIGLPVFVFTFTRLALVLPPLAILLLARKPPPKAIFVLTGALQVMLVLLAFYGLYIEPFRLGVTELSFSSPAFLADRPLRILQISDLHVERITRRERDVLEAVKKLQPDMIVLTGDYVNLDYENDPTSLQDTHSLLSQLSATYGVYAVIGTTDTPALMANIFNGLDIHVLEDEMQVVNFPGGGLTLLGVTNTSDLDRDRHELESLMAGLSPEAYTVLLYHTPDLIETASATGVNLYLAGHTHGGQIRLPFYGAIVTFSKYGKKYEMGEYTVGATTLYVSRGIGMEGFAPRIRFLCPPELVAVELGK